MASASPLARPGHALEQRARRRDDDRKWLAHLQQQSDLPGHLLPIALTLGGNEELTYKLHGDAGFGNALLWHFAFMCSSH